MAKHIPKLMTLPLSVLKRIEQVPSFALDNPRQNKAPDESLIANLAQNGQLVAGRAEITKVDAEGKILEAVTLQGNLRHKAIEEAARRKLVDPRTGKIFDSMEVLVHPIGSLTDVERHNYIHDHSNVTDLDRYETYLTFCNHFRTNLSVEQMLISSGALLERNFFGGNTELPTVKIKQPDGTFKDEINYTEWAEKKRGRIQHLKRIWELPTVARLAYETQMKGGKNWITDKDVITFHKAFIEERKACNEGKLIDKGILPETISPDKPGPGFMEVWNRKIAARDEATAKGTRVKSTNMLNNKSVTEMKDNTSSRTIKAVLLFVLNMRDRDPHLQNLQEALLKFESDPKLSKVLDSILTLSPTPATTEAQKSEPAPKSNAA